MTTTINKEGILWKNYYTSTAMSLFILALILNGVLATDCDKLPQEIKNLRNSFDFYTFKSHPVPDTGDSKGVPTIKVTCDKNKTWTNPLTQLEYDCPDQMNCDSIECNTGGSSGSVTVVYTNSSDFEESVSVSYSEDHSKCFGIVHTQTSKEFTDSVGVYLYQKKIRTVAYVEVNQCTFSWNPLVELTLDDYALEFYNNTIGADTPFSPDTVENFEDFFKIIQPELKFGIEYGGRAHATYDTDIDYFRTYHDTGVYEQSSGSFLNMMSAKGGGGSSTHNVTDDFIDATSITTSWNGGKCDPIGGPPDGQYKEWVETVEENPVPIKISSELPQGGNFEISVIVPKKGRDAMLTARINHNNVNALRNCLVGLDKMTDKIDDKKAMAVRGTSNIWPPTPCVMDAENFPSNYGVYANCMHGQPTRTPINNGGYPATSEHVHTPTSASFCSCHNIITDAIIADYTNKGDEATQQVKKVEEMINSTKTSINTALNKYNPSVVSVTEALSLYAMFAETAYEVENDQQKTIECFASCGTCAVCKCVKWDSCICPCQNTPNTPEYYHNISAGPINSGIYPIKFETYEKWP